MSDEKADEFISWRGRLASPDALPSQRLDNPEAVWQQLNARLVHGAGQGKAALRQPARYWVAAATILLLFVPAALLYHGARQTGAVPGRSIESGLPAGGSAGAPAGGPPALSRTFAKAPERSDAPRNANQGLKNNLADTRTTTPARLRGSRDLTTADRPVLAPAQQPIAGLTTPPITTAPSISDSATRLAVVTTPVRKQLRVISINEIDHPAAAAPSITTRWPGNHLRIILSPRSNPLPPETASQEQDPNPFKIRLTP